MHRSKQDLLLGLVFFTGLAGLLFATLMLTDVGVGGTDTVRRVHFAEVGRLQNGDKVFVLGKSFGLVEKVEFEQGADDPNERFMVTMRLQQPLDMYIDATVEIADNSFLGGRVLEVDPGGRGQPLPVDTILSGTVRENVIDALGNTFDEEAQDNLQAILRNLRSVSDRLSTPDNSVGALLNERDLYDEARALLGDVRGAVQDFRAAIGPGSQSLVGRLLNDQQLGDDGASILEDLAIAVSPNGTGIASAILHSTGLRDRVDNIVANLDRATAVDGEGPLARFLHDIGWGERIDSGLTNLDGVLAKANDPQGGIVGWLLGDPEGIDRARSILENIDSASAGIDRIVTEIEEGEGLLATLINDPEVSEQFSRLLNQVSRAVEDAREAAPVSTFVSVLIQAF